MKGREGGREENEEKEEEDKNCQMNERLFNLNHHHMTIKAQKEREIVQAGGRACTLIPYYVQRIIPAWRISPSSAMVNSTRHKLNDF